ncbi:MAG: nitroreductase family protein [Spirochaetales bacterium]|nr:nitroreductase family protein [Spirochaetales bacterium]
MKKSIEAEKYAIALDKSRCTRCGVCIKRMKGYCISERDGYPVFNYALCNTCQKCVAVCPAQAITVNNIHAEKIKVVASVNPVDMLALMEQRRSTKIFASKPLPEGILKQIVSTAKYAPNQNKNIRLIVIDDKKLIAKIDANALSFVRFFYRLLFGFKPLTLFFKLFAKGLDEIKRKMEYELQTTNWVVKPNTQAIVIAVGDKKVPVTGSSAHHLLAAMIYYAESLGVGSCLMDSLLYTLKTNGRLRKQLGIRKNVLGVLTLGYSGERIVNIPRGYEIDVQWNTGNKCSQEET